MFLYSFSLPLPSHLVESSSQKWTNDAIASRTSICSPLWRANSTIVASFKCARPPNTLMTFIHNATGRSCEVERVVCYFINAPRKREKELYIQGREIETECPSNNGNKNRESVCELSSIARVAEVLVRFAENSLYCFDLNNISNNTLFIPI